MVATRKVLAWANKAARVICGGWGFSFCPQPPFSKEKTEMTNPLDDAARNRRDSTKQIEAIQADRDLTPEAKARQIGELRQRTNADFRRAQTASRQEKQQARDGALKRLFGLGRQTERD